MSHDPVDDLRKEIAKGRVLAIVGAGLSIGATRNAPTASWTGLLKNGVDRCVAVAQPLPAGWEDRVRGQINSDTIDLLLAAENISQRLGAPEDGEYRRWLREAVGSLKAIDRSALEALRDLHVPLATTNYDGLLEEVTGLLPVTWREGAKVESVIRGDEEGILHLHGYWEGPESVVLGSTSYEKIRRDARVQIILRTLRTIRTLLFIGCGEGLTDPNMGGLLLWSREIFAGSEYLHYRLCQDSEAPDLRRYHPKQERIVVLPYGPSYADLAAFLRSLRPAAPEKGKRKEPSLERAPRLPPLPHYFGRTDQVEELVAALCAEPPQPTPILGPPGVGKTTITVTALHDPRVVEKYGARRYFVRCDGAKSLEALVGEIVTTLGIEPGPNLEDLLFLDLEHTPVILALDNAETPWEADTVAVEDLLTRISALPAVALIISLRGEQRPYGPKWKEAIHVVPLDLEATRMAFLAVAGERYRNDPDLDRFLEAVDRLPLAVILLAYRAQGEPSLSGLWKRWQEERTALLRRADAKERLTNLEVSLELSIQGPRMTEPARRLLSLLGVLPDGIAQEDLNTLLPKEGEDAASVLRKVGLAIAYDPRLRVLAPVREHVGRQHHPQQEDLARIAAHFLDLAQLGEKVGREGGAEAIQRLTPELGNLETVVLRKLEASDPTPAINAALPLARFYRFTGLGTINLLEKARDAARDTKNKELEARCIQSLGAIALHRSDHDTALARYQEARLLYEHIGNLRGQAACIRKLGNIAFDHSDDNTARERFQAALSLFQQTGDLLGQASCILSLGDIALRLSEYDEAYERFQEALPLFQQGGDPLGQASCVLRFGYVDFERPDYDTASERFEEALPLFQKLGDPLGQANCIRNLGEIALRRGDYDIAYERFQQALTLYERVGSLHGQGNCIQRLGDIARERSELDTARERYQEALALYERIPDPYPIGWAQVSLARLASTPEKERHQRAEAAREAWTRIKRLDLLKELNKEFGGPRKQKPQRVRTRKGNTS